MDKPFRGTVDQLLKKSSEISEDKLTQIELQIEKNNAIHEVMKLGYTESEAEEIYEAAKLAQIKQALEELIEAGEVVIVGHKNGEPLYGLPNKGSLKSKGKRKK